MNGFQTWIRDAIPSIWPMDPQNVIWLWSELGWVLGLIGVAIFASDFPATLRQLKGTERLLGAGHLGMTLAAVAAFVGLTAVDAGWLAVGFASMAASAQFVGWADRRAE